MKNSEKQNKSNNKDKISFDLISNRIDYLVSTLTKSVEQLIFEEKKKVKIKAGTIYAGQFTAEINEIQNTYKNYLKKAPLNLESYLSSLNTRAQDLNDMLFKIKTYPIKSITNQLKKEAPAGLIW